MTDTASELRNFLAGAASWSSFAASLNAAWDKYGSLTQRQWDAAHNMMAKAKAAAELAAKPREAVDLAPISAMFDKARENGLNKLAYRAEGLVISPAGSTSKNVGALYVKTEDTKEYQGKVMGGTWQPIRNAEPFVADALRVIARNPAEAATAYGQRTGRCACCGRELTNAESIARAIGPICAEKWGL